MRSSLSRSFVTILAARGVSKVLMLGAYLVVARGLGTSDFGRFSYHLAFAQMLGFMVDLGLTATSVRDSARGTADADTVLRVSLTGKLLLLIPALTILPFLAAWNSDSGSFFLAVLAFVVVISDSFAMFFHGPFRLQDDLRPMAAAEVARAVLFVGFILLFGLAGSLSPASALMSYAASALITVLIPIVILRGRGHSFMPLVRLDMLRQLLAASIIISLASATYDVASRFGLLLIDRYWGPAAVGEFSAAYLFLANLATLPLLLSMAIFPRLALLSSAGEVSTRSLLTRILSGSMLLALPVMIIGPILAKSIMAFAFGARFDSSSPILTILFVASGFMFINKVLWYLLIARNQHRMNLAFAVAALLVNVLMSFALIPTIGAAGAALAILGMEIVLLVLPMISLGVLLPVREVLPAGLAAALASVATGAVLMVLHFLPFPALGLTAVLLYGGLVWLLCTNFRLGAALWPAPGQAS